MPCSKWKSIIYLLMLLLLLVFLAACSGSDNETIQQLQPEPPPTTVIKITAAGDFLMHLPVVNSAVDPTTGSYNFKPIFELVRPYFEGADLALVNLETRLAGRERGYSGYPLFNSPAELAAEMKSIGVDLVLTANNHSLDMGARGLLATLNNLDAAGLDHIGNYRSREERDKPYIKDINGIRVGFLNYTQSTNGLPAPPGQEYLVNMIDRELMLADIKATREAGADFIIACPHFGTEYQRHPNEYQEAVVTELFQAGVDAVLGNHAHVVQPMELVKLDNRDQPAFVAYSLGNFISNQRWRYSDSGIIVNLYIEKNHQEQSARLIRAEWVPIWVHTYPAGGKSRYRVLPVDEAIAWYENQKDPLLTEEDYIQLLEVRNDLNMHLGERILNLE